MRKPFAAAVGLLALLATAPGASRASESVAQARTPLTFMVMIATPQEEKETGVLIDSLRTFGGEYAQSPVVLVLSDPQKTDGRALADKVQQTVVLEMDEQFRPFPFSDKVYACAQVEELVAQKTDWLVWLNPDCLILAEPRALTADPAAWAALRPVHIRNIGAPADGPVPDYWQRIYAAAGVDPEKTWTVESFVDREKLRAYFNSGCMAFAPDKGILRGWREAYATLLADPAAHAFYTSDRSYAIFCHQAVLSAVVVAQAGKERVNLLPPSYGYPLPLQDQAGFANRMTSLWDIVIAIGGTPESLRKIEITDLYQRWIETNVL